MSKDELAEIIDRGCAATSMHFADDVVSTIVEGSLGSPYYTHLLSLAAARQAVTRGSKQITPADLKAGLRYAAEIADSELKDTYETAIHSHRKPEGHARKILEAAALLGQDDFGFDALKQAYMQVSRLKNTPRDDALQGLLAGIVGPILIERGDQRGRYYQFADPRMSTYIKIRNNRL